MLDRDTYPNENVIAAAAQVVPLKMNVDDKGKSLAAKYNITGLPTILFLDKDGEVVGKILGYRPPTAFVSEINKVLDIHKETPKIRAALRKDPKDCEANVKWIQVLAPRGDTDDALKVLEKLEKAECPSVMLARAYNAIGDLYQNNGGMDEAMTYFTKAEEVTADVAERSYAKVSMMSCRIYMKDSDSAKSIAKQIVALKNAPEAHVSAAKEVLRQ